MKELEVLLIVKHEIENYKEEGEDLLDVHISPLCCKIVGENKILEYTSFDLYDLTDSEFNKLQNIMKPGNVVKVRAIKEGDYSFEITDLDVQVVNDMDLEGLYNEYLTPVIYDDCFLGTMHYDKDDDVYKFKRELNGNITNFSICCGIDEIENHLPCIKKFIENEKEYVEKIKESILKELSFFMSKKEIKKLDIIICEVHIPETGKIDFYMNEVETNFIEVSINGIGFEYTSTLFATLDITSGKIETEILSN